MKNRTQNILTNTLETGIYDEDSLVVLCEINKLIQELEMELEEHAKRINSYFRDTLKKCNDDPYLQTAIQNSVKHSVIPETGSVTAPVIIKRTIEPTITVAARSIVEAASFYADTYPKKRIAVVNFIHDIREGEAFSWQSEAVHKSLYYCTTLYPCLHELRKDNDLFKYRYICIYTPDVKIIKTDDDIPAAVQAEEYKTFGAITCFAPDYTDWDMFYSFEAHGSNILGEWEQYSLNLYKKIIRSILQCASSQGTDILIIGSWGYGLHEENYSLVANAYQSELSEYENYFEIVEFSLDEGPEADIYKEFERAFNVRE